MNNFERIEIHGIGFNIYTEDDLVIDIIKKNGGYENTSLQQWIIESFNASGVVIDAGSYTGIYSFITSTVNKEVNIYAFEPVANVYKRLEDNKSINTFDNVNCFKFALGDSNTTKIMNTRNSLVLPTASTFSTRNKYVNAFETPVRTIDSLIDNTTEVSLMKIDVERFEEEVINGAINTITTWKPTIFIQILDQQALDNIKTQLEALGYNNIKFIDEISESLVNLPLTFKPGNYFFKKI